MAFVVSKRAISVLVAAVMCVALLPSVAPAAAVWTPPGSLGSGQNAWIATNSAGDAIAVMQRGGPHAWGEGGARLYAAFRAAGGTWSEPRVISAAGGDVIGAVDVEMGPGGDATVVWTNYSSISPNGYEGPTQHQVTAARLLGDGTWETTQLAEWRGLRSVSAATDAGGTTTVAWAEFADCEGAYGGPPCRMYINNVTRPAGGAWHAPSLVADNASGPALAAAPDGTVTMVFRHAAVDSSNLVTVTRPPGGAWGEQTVLTTADRWGSRGVVAESNGDVTATWTECGVGDDSQQCRLHAAVRPASGDWGGVETVYETMSPSGSNAIVSSLIATPNEGAVAAWNHSSSDGTARIMAAVRGDDDTWSRPATLSSSSTFAYVAPSLAVDAAGNGAATWTEWTTPERTTVKVQAAYRPAAGVWAAPATLESGLSTETRTGVAATGDDTFTAIFNGNGDVAVSDRVDDRTAPTAEVSSPSAPARTRTKIRVAWSARDDQAGVASTAVRRRVARYDSGFEDWRLWLPQTSSREVTFNGRPGRTYCFSARATDRAGNTGRWSGSRCTSTPVDDRSAIASSGWRRAVTTASYRDTSTVTSRRGEVLSLAGVRGRKLYLVAKTCPRCGEVTVRLGERWLKRVSLRSAQVRHRRLLPVAAFARIRSGTLKVRVSTDGKPVAIDGLVAAR